MGPCFEINTHHRMMHVRCERHILPIPALKAQPDQNNFYFYFYVGLFFLFFRVCLQHRFILLGGCFRGRYILKMGLFAFEQGGKLKDLFEGYRNACT